MKEEEEEKENWLVINRKIGEQIAIGDDILIDVARIRGHDVRLAIKAPRDVVVIRKTPPSPSGKAFVRPRDDS